MTDRPDMFVGTEELAAVGIIRSLWWGLGCQEEIARLRRFDAAWEPCRSSTFYEQMPH